MLCCVNAAYRMHWQRALLSFSAYPYVFANDADTVHIYIFIKAKRLVKQKINICWMHKYSTPGKAMFGWNYSSKSSGSDLSFFIHSFWQNLLKLNVRLNRGSIENENYEVLSEILSRIKVWALTGIFWNIRDFLLTTSVELWQNVTVLLEGGPSSRSQSSLAD